KLILAYLGKAKTLQKTIEDDRLLSTKTSFSSFSKKTKITKEEKLVREQQILDCLNKAYEISQDKSLLDANQLSQDNINAMNEMFNERSKLLEKFKDLSHEVNELKKDGIDATTIDQSVSNIQAKKIIEVVEASPERTEEQQLKLESLDATQIVLAKKQVSQEEKFNEQEQIIASVVEDQELLPESLQITQNQSPMSNNTSAKVQADPASLKQNDPNKKQPQASSKTYTIQEQAEQITKKHGSRSLSKSIDIFDPKDSAEQDQVESAIIEHLSPSLLGTAAQESSEFDKG
ncbi:MAG: hypothetical protein SFT93_05095, partial [Rickettsiaceae bacterium]|nr:hypothetical protein [Rickettsiaceae bacterium]